MSEHNNPPPDTLNSIGVLKRREIEARILIPFVKALGDSFGEDQVRTILRDTIIKIAQEQGRSLAEQMGSDNLGAFSETLKYWTQDGALEIDVLEQSQEQFDFNVTRCRYAELYRALGIPELGALLSCNRDFSLIEGYNQSLVLTRTQTLMEGAGHCDFRYHLRRETID